LPKTTTDEGITIDFNPLRQKADSLIRFSLNPHSNTTNSSTLQSEKLEFPKPTTVDGITTDRNELVENADFVIFVKFEPCSNARTDRRALAALTRPPEPHDCEDEAIQTRCDSFLTHTAQEMSFTNPCSTTFCRSKLLDGFSRITAFCLFGGVCQVGSRWGTLAVDQSPDLRHIIVM
jgi:hypothetical protein